MVQRLLLEDVKSFWFENNLVIYLTQIDGSIYALPKIEAERALKYCESLEKCKTYNDVQALSDQYLNDLDKPKLIPKIRSLKDELEGLEEMWISEDSLSDRDYGDLSDQDLINYWLPREFTLLNRNVPNIYLDETQTLMLIRDFQVWTDAWMPKEAAKELGTLDKNFGIDYQNAELIYQDLNAFQEYFIKEGFVIQIDEPRFLKLLSYV